MNSSTTNTPVVEDNVAHSAPMYRSGTAARLSGIPVETLRVWERRYELVSPKRSDTGHREYSIEEVRHLILIKQLVDRGNPIGAIAHLAPSELRVMLNREPLVADESSIDGQPISTLIVAERMSGCLAGIDRYSTLLQVIAYCENLRAASAESVKADLLLMEMSEIGEVECTEINQLRDHIGARGGLILYRFARHEALRKLRAAGYVVARVPTDMKELESLCRLAAVCGTPPQTNVTSKNHNEVMAPAVQFDDQALEAIALASNSVHCECPRHLVEILQVLGSFERYSLQCENRSPADERLHSEIYQATARARSMIEQALVKVARFEGLPLP